MDEALHLQRKGSGNELDREEHTKKEIDKHRARNEMFQIEESVEWEWWRDKELVLVYPLKSDQNVGKE